MPYEQRIQGGLIPGRTIHISGKPTNKDRFVTISGICMGYEFNIYFNQFPDGIHIIHVLITENRFYDAPG